MKEYIFSVKILSPVHIGGSSEDKLLQNVDFIRRGNKIGYIDTDKLLQKIKESAEDDKHLNTLIKNYKKILVKHQQRMDSKELESFIESELGEKLETFISNWYDVLGSFRGNMIRKTISIKGRPYISGSTLKGAIRMALFYDYIKKQDKFILELKDIISTNNGKKLKDSVRELLKKWEQRWLNDSTKSLFGYEAKVERKENKQLNNNIASLLRIADSEPFKKQDKIIVSAERVNIKNPRSKQRISQNYEAIKRGSRSYVKITLAEYLQRSFIYDINDIIEKVNNFTLDYIDWEIKQLKGDDFVDIRSFLRKDIKENILKAKNTMYIRIGAAKNFFNQTIGLILEEKGIFKDIREKFGIGRSHRDGSLVYPFPITRSIIYEDEIPKYIMGWIKLSRDE